MRITLVSRQRVAALVALVVSTFGVAACSPSSLVDVQAPNTVVDPSLIGTISGAIQLRAAAVADITVPYAGNNNQNVVILGGLFTDELTYASGSLFMGPDERRMVDVTYGNGAGVALYGALHQARIRMQIARQALQLYAAGAPNAPAAWRGELFALEGYTVLWFAEYYCSGIPLTSVPLVGSPQPTAGLTTQALFTKAITLFDSAIVAGADSMQFVNLARVGKGRALLGLGEFAAADSAVRDVPTDFAYTMQFTPGGRYRNQVASYALGYFRAQDQEGGNGLTWSTDKRAGLAQSARTGAMWRPAKYNVTADGTLDPDTPQPGEPMRLADGLEARLIQAEASLAAGDASWLTTLNGLRHDCIGAAACAPLPGLTSVELPDTLTDPGTDSARVTVLFRERALWLYMTAHRQGDLRRLARVYHRAANTVWPTGIISSPAFPPANGFPLPENGTQYGSDVVFSPDPQERTSNALYAGCYDHNP